MELDSEIWFFSNLKEEKNIGFIIGETVIQIGNQHVWLWIATELIHKLVLR
jgi:hypothetical protein